jgi:hypothetical protein
VMTFSKSSICAADATWSIPQHALSVKSAYRMHYGLTIKIPWRYWHV